MALNYNNRGTTRLCRIVSVFMVWTFISTMLIPRGITAKSASQTVLNLPEPGVRIQLTSAFTPTLIKGITTYPENPFMFDFIVDTGETNLEGEELKEESNKLIKYFLASLTVPEQDLWVNLSPYEEERIIAQGFGRTEMGSDLLAQDYLLKQMTASITYPEEKPGREFWDRVYEKAYKEYGTTRIPINTFNKVWIVPEKAVVYTHNTSAFVVQSHLKVMLEEDYLSMRWTPWTVGDEREPHGPQQRAQGRESTSQMTTPIIRELIIPAIEKEVNEGKTFANLRQIFNSLILAAWYKRNLRQSLLGQGYADKNKIRGIDTEDRQINQKIYDQYIQAFRNGAYNYIRKDYDGFSRGNIRREYFSGGVVGDFSLTISGGVEEKTASSSLTPTQQGILKRILNGAGIFLLKVVLLTSDSTVYALDHHKEQPKHGIESAETKMVLRNPDFEKSSVLGPDKPEGWETLNEQKVDFADLDAIYKWDNKIFYSGKRAVKIEKRTENKEAGWVQRLYGLEEGSRYQISAWLKTQGIGGSFLSRGGAHISLVFFIEGLEPIVYESPLIAGTQDWRQQKLVFIVPEGCRDIRLLLGVREMKGVVWWDEISIRKLSGREDLQQVQEVRKSEMDQYGGWNKVKGKTTGFFHTEKIGGRWWIITPEGNGFIVVGLHGILDKNILDKVEKKDQASIQRQKSWGFNTLTGNRFLGLLKEFAYDAPVSPSLWGFPYFPDKAPEVRVPVGIDDPVAIKIIAFPDVFDERFKEILDSEFKKTATDSKNDPWLLGYFLGNELPWAGWEPKRVSLFDAFFALKKEKPGKKTLIKFLKERYDNVKAFNEVYGTNINNFDDLLNMSKLEEEKIKDKNKVQKDESAFLRLVAETYFRLNYELIKKYDPNHMILGVRFAGHTPKEVLEAIGNYVDIVSFNYYTPIVPLEELEESYKIHHKPILITEFSFKAFDSGLPNTSGGPGFKTQKDRGLWYQRYVSHLLSSPNMVGQVWYKYMDDPPRIGKENANVGLVNYKEEPYIDLMEMVKKVNRRIYHLLPRIKHQDLGKLGVDNYENTGFIDNLNDGESEKRLALNDDKKGGIEFNLDKFLKNFETQGKKMTFNPPLNLKDFENIDGLFPSIIRVSRGPHHSLKEED